jgi:hypothetical protein
MDRYDLSVVTAVGPHQGDLSESERRVRLLIFSGSSLDRMVLERGVSVWGE